MTILSASEARANLYRLMDEAAQETLFLLSVPGMRKSIKSGMNEAVDSYTAELDW